MNRQLRSSVVFYFLVAALAPAMFAAGLSCSPVNVLVDGGFERATGLPPESPDWAGSSTQFASPLCSVAACGIGGGSGPLTGTAWALFRGTEEVAGETASLSQQLTLPLGTAVDLHFFLHISTVTAPFDDLLEVRIDGDLLSAFPEPVTTESAYNFYTLPLDAYVDGGVHTLTFEFSGSSAGGLSHFNLDEVTLVVRQQATLLDGSFEAAVGDPLDSPNWTEASIEYFSPLCTFAQCGNGSGTVGPLTGDVWAWFGGVGGSTPEVSSVKQTVLLPNAAFVDLEFQMGVGAVQAPFTDELNVRMDGTEIASLLEPVVADTAYLAHSVIVDPYADGLPHELTFEYIKGVDGNGANFSLDDVVLTEVSCQAILLDSFETHDLSNWSSTMP